LKDILLVDMNAFFIMCEGRNDPSLINAPSAVAGSPQYRTGIILAANYEARKYGVKVAMTVTEAKRLCPEIRLVKPNHDYYEACSKEVFDLLYDFTPQIEKNSIDEAWLDVTSSKDLFGSVDDIALGIQNKLKDELGLWSSIGISENKFLAKMASDLKKPLGISKLYKKDIERIMYPMPLGKMYGLGRVTEKKLNVEGIYNIGQLAELSSSYLISKFGKVGYYLYEKARGIDDDIVGEQDIKNPSCGRMTTLERDISDLEVAKKEMAPLCEDVGRSLRDKNLVCDCVQIQIKYDTFKMITRQMKVEETNLTSEIYKTASYLLDLHWDNEKPVRLIGVSACNLREKSQQIQFDFDNMMGNEKLETTMDEINKKFNKNIIKRGNTL